MNQIGLALSGASGTGAFAGNISPNFTTPALGTPSAGVLSSCTAYAQSALTGLGTGVSTALAANVTGSGGIALVTSPTFVTPVLGTPSSGNLSACTGYLAANISGAFSSIISAPAVSQSSSLALASAYQNPFGYDVVLTVYLAITSATTANILLGVGSTNTPTQQTIISGLTLAALGIVPVTIYLPTGYFALLSTTGTIALTISGQQAMPV